jgi:hypothetical protein
MNGARKTLLAARKLYSHCAAAVEKKTATGFTSKLSEQIVGIGIAAEWVRRAAEMDDIAYRGVFLNKSQKKSSFVELMRYGFAWYGLNAIFTRPELLHLVGTPANASEFGQFRVLFDAASLPNEAGQSAKLHAILAANTSPRLPDLAPATAVSTLQAIDAKYIPAHTKTKGASKLVADAAAAGTITSLKLPTLLYAFRNWSVHGNALDGAFGSRPRFLEYVGVLLEVLGDVHVSTATLLRSKL